MNSYWHDSKNTEVESVLSTHPKIEQMVLIPKPHDTIHMSNPTIIPFTDEKGNGRKMTLRLDNKIVIPLFEQIRAQISVMIAVGYLLPHCRLPTVRELAVCLQIAPGTIARSYTELERDGLVIGKGRKGTFVTDEPPHSEPLEEKRFRLSESNDFISSPELLIHTHRH